jgi:stearoyl-CoA desaturase (delta-9 desaturase)
MVLAVSRAARFRRSFQPKSWPFWAVHLVAIIGVVMSGWSWAGLALAVGLYWPKMFVITAGYHRYFSHRSFKTSRAFQLVLGVLCSMTAQKGILWWAAHHRRHHKFSDQEGDIHSFKRDGAWWSHVGWIVGSDAEFDATDLGRIKDLARYPELVWLNRHWYLFSVAVPVALFLIGGWHALLWGFFVSTVITWHGSFSINSLSHLIGRRRYATTDESRNSFGLALLTMGEGWHNNHHHYMTACNQGWRWYEVDMTYYLLRMMSWAGLVWDLRTPPRHVVEGVVAPAEVVPGEKVAVERPRRAEIARAA